MEASFNIDPDQLRSLFSNLERPTTLLTRKIAGIMADAVEENFDQEGIPKWAALSPRTIKQREKKGYTGKILQRTGALAASIAQDYGDDYARVSTANKYAAIQNFGGRAGRGGSTVIPARPFMALDAVAEEEIEDAVRDFFSL